MTPPPRTPSRQSARTTPVEKLLLGVHDLGQRPWLALAGEELDLVVFVCKLTLEVIE